MVAPLGLRHCGIIGKCVGICLAIFITVQAAVASVVEAEKYQSFFLWAGVRPQPALKKAQEIYLLAGEVSGGDHPHIVSQRSTTPHLPGLKLWVVYRAQTIEWNDAILNDVLRHIETWRAAGNAVEGLQIDFDSGTKNLGGYIAFLTKIREHLPPRYRLSITGLLDWSAHANAKDFSSLDHVVEEVVLQTYQGRHVIVGYDQYLHSLPSLGINFKIGLLQGANWVAPAELETNPRFKGYVVFLVNSTK